MGLVCATACVRQRYTVAVVGGTYISPGVVTDKNVGNYTHL